LTSAYRPQARVRPALRKAPSAAVQGPSLLAVFNAETNHIEKTIKVGSRPHWVATGPGGKTALTTNEDSNDVSIVDLESGAITNIPVGNGPRKIAVQTAAAQQRSSSRRVIISGFAFTPESLQVGSGESVTWINDDGAPHSVALKSGKASDTLMRIELQRGLRPSRQLRLSLLHPSLYDWQNTRHSAPGSARPSIILKLLNACELRIS
jgi:YVTN family beta-propeller protein